jgi:hypothetical protein
VFWGTQPAGDATAGYKWSNEAPTNVAENTGNPVEICKVVQVHAKAGGTLTAQEAANSVRKAYGDSMVTGAMKVVLTTNVEEKTAI